MPMFIEPLRTMELGNILNTKTSKAVAGFRPMLYDTTMSSFQHELQHPQPQHQHQVPFTHPYLGGGRIKSEHGGSDRAISPHPSDPSSRYSTTPSQSIAGYSMPQTFPIDHGQRYPSPTAMASSVPMLNPYVPTPQAPDNPYHGPPQSNSPAPPKAFACSTCQKGFARRSDLARHERIHSGVRPHVCDHLGCGKQFIQRSALTVHQRVHTGEKPHMCERCGKPFSDSSSLARHRRIHSGKRPYKCPYADCQKTFTRRTTLTRHQNHHTGTIEEAAAMTAAALASRQSGPAGRATRSDAGDYSDAGSPMPTPSPHQRPMSMSPAAGMSTMGLHRSTSEFASYATMGMGGAIVPPHLRSEIPQPSPRSSPSLTSQPYPPMSQPQPRAPMTSHPVGYGPPQVLEPPTQSNNSQSSTNGSPHMGAMGWQSPSQQGLPSPTAGDAYAYTDQTSQYTNAAAQNIYYQNMQQRPGSTDPGEHYNARHNWAQPGLSPTVNL